MLKPQSIHIFKGALELIILAYPETPTIKQQIYMTFVDHKTGYIKNKIYIKKPQCLETVSQ